MARALIALGANLGDRAVTLRAAIDQLSAEPDVKLMSASRWHDTVPSGGPIGQPAYLNGAALFETSLSPGEFFQRLVRTENQLGRKRDVRWGPRTLDLDLLLYDDVTMQSPSLELPHPRLAVRRFVLEPAVEIAGGMKHPRIGWSIERLLHHLANATPYVAITGVPRAGKTELAREVATLVGSAVMTLDDPAGRSAVRSSSPPLAELEFLRARCEQLAEFNWPDGGGWLISDFWLEQSLAYSRVELPPTDRSAVSAAVEAASRRVVAPKLTVLLEGAVDSSGMNDEPSPPASASASQAALDRLAGELSNAVNRPDLGPVLRLKGRNQNEAAQELASALETMR